MSVPGTGRSPIRIALEQAIVTFFVSLISSVIATGAPYPPTIGSIYGPGLVALGWGIAAYAAARQIALPQLPVVPPTL